MGTDEFNTVQPVETQSRRPVWVVIIGLALLFLMVGFAITYNRWSAANAREASLHESQRQDFALCVAQNQSRAQTRSVAQSTYALVAGVLRTGGPDDQDLKRTFTLAEAKLSQQLKALKPLDCETYVRPDLPPDSGVR